MSLAPSGDSCADRRQVAIRLTAPAGRLTGGERIVHSTGKIVRIRLPLDLPLRGGRRLVIAGAKRAAQPDATLIAALRKAHRMIERERGLPRVTSAPASLYSRRILQLAFLAPELQRDILTGLQPPSLNLEQLMGIALPLAWDEQRKVLGW